MQRDPNVKAIPKAHLIRAVKEILRDLVDHENNIIDPNVPDAEPKPHLKVSKGALDVLRNAVEAGSWTSPHTPDANYLRPEKHLELVPANAFSIVEKSI